MKSVTDECSSKKLILFGETSLRRVLREYRVHYHGERNHKGKNNILLIPAATKATNHVDGSASFIGEVECCSACAKTLACVAKSALQIFAGDSSLAVAETLEVLLTEALA